MGFLLDEVEEFAAFVGHFSGPCVTGRTVVVAETPEKDIEIKISGLRPGEKLFEELQYGDENVDKTTHKDIFICKLTEVDDKVLTPALKALKDAAEAGDKDLSEKLLFELVPSEYRKEHHNKDARV